MLKLDFLPIISVRLVPPVPGYLGAVGSVQELIIGGRWFGPRHGQYSFQGLMIVTSVHCVDDGYVGKQPVAWKEYYAEYWYTKMINQSFQRYR